MNNIIFLKKDKKNHIRLKTLNVDIIEIIIDHLFYGDNMKLRNLIEFKKTCKLYFFIVSDYIKRYINKKNIYNNIYREDLYNKEPNIYIYIKQDFNLRIEKRYIKFNINNMVFYSYNYYIYVNDFQKIQKIFYLNIFRNESLKNIIIIYDLYELSYIKRIEDCIMYERDYPVKIVYNPIINYIHLCFNDINCTKFLFNGIFNFIKTTNIINTLNIYSYEKNRSDFITHFLNYIINNNIKIKNIEWNIYLNLDILYRLYLNKNIYKIIITDNSKNRKYINNKKWKYNFNKKIKIESFERRWF